MRRMLRLRSGFRQQAPAQLRFAHACESAQGQILRFAQDFAAGSDARNAQLYKSFLRVQLSFYQGNNVSEMITSTQLPPDSFTAPWVSIRRANLLR
jgi:hypothetical protein